MKANSLIPFIERHFVYYTTSIYIFVHCCFRSRHNGKKRGEDDANTGRKAMKDKKWLVPSFIGVLLLAAIACVAISIYVGWNLTHKERKVCCWG